MESNIEGDWSHVTWAWSGSGSGSAGDPYVLADANDWATFAENINAGTDAGKCYKLADNWDNENVPVTVTVGTADNPFTGTFDGNGKTLYVTINNTQSQGTAPFSHVTGATIKNLTVAGSVTGTRHVAGLVGFVHQGGTTTLSGCVVKPDVINNAGDGEGYIGGLVGHGTTATIMIENCVFSGNLTNNNNLAGGLVGWSDNANITFTNSFFTGTHSGNGQFHPIALHNKDCQPAYTDNGAFYISSSTSSMVTENQTIGLSGRVVYKDKPSGNYVKITAQDGNEYYVEGITFNVRSWDAENKQVVTTPTGKPVTILSGEHSGDWAGLTNGYYLVNSNTKYDALNIMGDDVHLILSNSARLTCSHVKLEGSNKLHIHNVSDDNTGELYVWNYYLNSSTVTHSAVAVANVSYNGHYDDAAAIGSGGGQGVNMGSLYVHGGTINVRHGSLGAGIGGGKDGCIGGEVVIYGGEVTTLSYRPNGGGAGIGGGCDCGQGGPVTIYGGKVTITAAKNAAGIGGGTDGGHGGKVEIYGGTVNVRGGEYAAGIGGGNDGHGGNVSIYGGDVTVRGGNYGACIGGGDDGDQGGTVAIHGGNVTISVYNALIDDYTNAIGGGHHGNGGTVLFYGGEITLLGGKRARAVGGDASFGTITFADNLRVAGGNVASKIESSSIERVFTNGEREPACRWRNYVTIKTCEHTQPTEGSDTTEPFYYTIDDETNHTKHCRYCNETWQETHSGTNCVCGKESSCQFTVYVPDETKDTYKEGSTTTVGAGKTFLLPACTTIPEGYTFKGWKMNPDPDDNHWAYVKAGDVSGDLILPQASVTALPGQDNAKFYARFLYIFKPTWVWAGDGSTAQVTLSHKDLNDDVILSSTDFEPMVTITSADLTENMTIMNNETTHEEDVKIGTRYTATCTYSLDGNEYTFSDTHDVLDFAANQAPDQNYWTTYYCGQTGYKIVEENACAYTAKYENSQLTLYKLGKVIPKGTAVIIVSADNNISMTESTEAAENNVSNDLHGVDVRTEKSTLDPSSNKSGVFYVMGMVDGNFGFFEYTGDYMPAGKAYLLVDDGVVQARELTMVFGEETGIRPTPGPSLNGGEWYDLSGRKLDGQPTKSGVYINKGKKVYVK